jgi:hypothetical protein
MARLAKGTITFLYNLDEDPYFEMFEDGEFLLRQETSDEAKMKYFREAMAEDLIALSYDWPNLPDSIEMEIVEDVR